MENREVLVSFEKVASLDPGSSSDTGRKTVIFDVDSTPGLDFSTVPHETIFLERMQIAFIGVSNLGSIQLFTIRPGENVRTLLSPSQISKDCLDCVRGSLDRARSRYADFEVKEKEVRFTVLWERQVSHMCSLLLCAAVESALDSLCAY
jgi:hypothetical protein